MPDETSENHPSSVDQEKHLQRMEMFRQKVWKQNPDDVLVPLNKNKTGPAFYCVHTLSGVVTGLSRFAKLLEPDVRFYGIQVPEKLRNGKFSESIEAMARHYVDAIEHAQPEGPILLGGSSAGVSVALEMAHQLTAHGRKVNLLVAIDKAPENITIETKRSGLSYYGGIMVNFPSWITQDGFNIKSVKNRIRNTLSKKTTPTTLSSADGRPAPHPADLIIGNSNFSDEHMDFARRFHDAACRYNPRQYGGPVVVYEAQTRSSLMHPVVVGKKWKEIATDASVVKVKGTHRSVTQYPPIQLTDDLRKRIKQAVPTEVDNASPAPAHRPEEELGTVQSILHTDRLSSNRESGTKIFLP